MSVSMNDTVIQRLRESRLLDDEQWRELLRDNRLPGAEGALTWLKERNLLTDWQLSELLRGRRDFFLGKYRLLRLLGHGGMGEVYLAEHVTMHRRAAIKLISPRISRNPQAVEQFLTEARSIAALDHPNIVHAYNVDTFGDQYYLVMEYVEGESLQELVNAHGPLPIPEAADVIRQCAEGLSHVHERGILHCDIKPANLLINAQGVVKILDLGMARLIQGERAAGSQPQDGLLGSVDFMAPEMAMQSGSLDRRADIYSLGCTFFFALTGRAPFAEGTVVERILKHQMTPPP
ncbi:MAG: serine/threonine protein kinase, partial [Thermogutta sp.]|nr:serine/threonine protein kinase [Thermogutta sp.]